MDKEKKETKVQDQKKKDTIPEYSEEDLLLIEKIAFKVERITSQEEKNPITHLKELLEMILTSKKSRTSIPKEIKFLKKHYNTLASHFETLKKHDLFR